MTKVFKVIMNIILVLFIVALCALFVPPLLGITTAVADTNSETNMDAGSVAYGKRESLSSLNAGDKIIYNTEDETYIYEITEVDSVTGELTVRTSEEAEPQVIELRRTASKLLIVIPFIGYILIATQSFEGLIILGLVAALIIILTIIASILDKKAQDEEDGIDDDEDDEDSDFGYFQNLAASTSKPNRLDALGTMSLPTVNQEDIDTQPNVSPETAALDEELEDIPEFNSEASNESSVPLGETINLNLSKTDKLSTGELPVEEISDNEPDNNEPKADPSDDIIDAISETTPVKPEAADIQTDEIIEVSETDDSPEAVKATEIAEEKAVDTKTFEEESEVKSETDRDPVKASDISDISGIGNALEYVLGTDQMNQTEESPAAPQPLAAEDTEEADTATTESVSESKEEIELAIPSRSLDELLQEAYSKGEDPQVRKDDATGITFVDYSSCLK